MQNELKDIFVEEHAAFTVKQFKGVVKYFVSVVWLLFLFLDYYYLPRDLFWLWASLRILVVTVWLSTSRYIGTRFLARKYQFISAANILVSTLALNIMIYFDSYPSAYILGLILSHQMGTVLLKLTRTVNVVCSLISYAMCVVVTAMNPASDIRHQMAILVILSGFIAFNFQYSTDEIDHFSNQVYSRENARKKGESLAHELERKFAEERMTRSFSPTLIEKVKRNERKFSRFLIQDAVIGIVDIKTISEKSDSLRIEESWDIKSLFTEVFIEEAKKRGCVPLPWTGEGFMFICNFFDEDDWHFRLAALIEVLHQDFESIVHRASVRVETGLKFGIARGQIIFGHLGKQKAFYTAHGPAINLAASLCSEAGSGETAVSEAVFAELDSRVSGLVEKRILTYKPHGWQFEHQARILVRDLKEDEGVRCEDCQTKMFTVMNENSHWDVLCPRCSPS